MNELNTLIETKYRLENAYTDMLKYYKKTTNDIIGDIRYNWKTKDGQFFLTEYIKITNDFNSVVNSIDMLLMSITNLINMEK